jgi:hypothetical protein
MRNLSTNISRNKGQARPRPKEHDPNVCGLGSEWDCDNCRAAAKAEEREAERIRRRARRKAERRRTRPEARKLARLMRLHRRMFARVILSILDDSITDIALAVSREVHRCP